MGSKGKAHVEAKAIYNRKPQSLPPSSSQPQRKAQPLKQLIETIPGRPLPKRFCAYHKRSPQANLAHTLLQAPSTL